MTDWIAFVGNLFESVKGVVTRTDTCYSRWNMQMLEFHRMRDVCHK